MVTPPPPSLCDSLSGISATVPDLPGARSCQTVELGWICRFGESSATLSGRVQACVGGERDGDELYVSVDGGRLAVTPDREGASGSLLRYEPVP